MRSLTEKRLLNIVLFGIEQFCSSDVTLVIYTCDGFLKFLLEFCNGIP